MGVSRPSSTVVVCVKREVCVRRDCSAIRHRLGPGVECSFHGRVEWRQRDFIADVFKAVEYPGGRDDDKRARDIFRFGALSGNVVYVSYYEVVRMVLWRLEGWIQMHRTLAYGGCRRTHEST